MKKEQILRDLEELGYNLSGTEFGIEEYDEDDEIAAVTTCVNGIVEAFFINGCVMSLEKHLDELCHILGIRLTPGTPAMERKRKTGNLSWLLGYQQGIIDERRKGKNEEFMKILNRKEDGKV